MLSVLGRIQFGALELGGVSSGATPSFFNAVASPSVSWTTSGGSPARTYSSTFGWYIFGRVEPGQIRPDFLSFADLGNGTFIGTADPLGSFIGVASGGSTFVATADPLASFGVGGAFTGTADPIATFTAFFQPGFVATASPQASFSVQIGQSPGCVVAGDLEILNSPKNFVY